RAHRSRALPEAPQRKHCHTPRPRCAEKDRLRGEVAPCNGHAPRAWSPRHSLGCQWSSPSTTPRRTSRRAWRKSSGGMALLFPPGQRRGTRFVFLVLAAPEAVLVERLALAPQVEHGRWRPRRHLRQRRALTALAGLHLLPALGPLAAAQKQTRRLAEGPAPLGVAHLLAAGPFDLAGRLVVAVHQAGVGQQLPGAGETA